MQESELHILIQFKKENAVECRDPPKFSAYYLF